MKDRGGEGIVANDRGRLTNDRGRLTNDRRT